MENETILSKTDRLQRELEAAIDRRDDITGGVRNFPLVPHLVGLANREIDRIKAELKDLDKVAKAAIEAPVTAEQAPEEKAAEIHPDIKIAYEALSRFANPPGLAQAEINLPREEAGGCGGHVPIMTGNEKQLTKEELQAVTAEASNHEIESPTYRFTEVKIHVARRAFKRLEEEVFENMSRAGFWDEPRTDAELIALMHSEVSEAYFALRDGWKPSEHIPEFVAIEEELADLFIRIMDHSGHAASQGSPDSATRFLCGNMCPPSWGNSRIRKDIELPVLIRMMGEEYAAMQQQESTLSDGLLVLHGFLSAALETARKGAGTREGLAECLVELMSLAAHRNLKLGEAIEAKIAFNLERPRKHGKEF